MRGTLPEFDGATGTWLFYLITGIFDFFNGHQTRGPVKAPCPGYSLPNLFRSVKPTPKKRNAPTTQRDHVIA